MARARESHPTANVTAIARAHSAEANQPHVIEALDAEHGPRLVANDDLLPGVEVLWRFLHSPSLANDAGTANRSLPTS